MSRRGSGHEKHLAFSKIDRPAFVHTVETPGIPASMTLMGQQFPGLALVFAPQ